MQFQENIDLGGGAGLPPRGSPLSDGSGNELPGSCAPYLKHYKDLSGCFCSKVLIQQEFKTAGPILLWARRAGLLFLLCHCPGWVATGKSPSFSGFHLSVRKRPFYGPPTCWECPWDPGDHGLFLSPFLPPSQTLAGKGVAGPFRGRWMAGCRLQVICT